jgi:Ca2+/Na+ antiporter
MFVIFQSCAAGLANSLSENGEAGGTGGLFLAILFIVAGIVGLVTRKSEKKGGAIATAILYLLAGLVGFTSAGTYSDLYIWSGVAIVFAVIFIIGIFVGKKTAIQINKEGH